MYKSIIAVLITLSTITCIADTAKLPADVLTQDTKVLCVPGYSSTVRNVSASVAKQIYAKAGVPNTPEKFKLCSKGFEVDHRKSLENGGSNDISNLQLQAYCTYDELLATDGLLVGDKNHKPGYVVTPVYKGLYGAHQKDNFENQIHKQICTGEITVQDGQQKLKDWKN